MFPFMPPELPSNLAEQDFKVGGLAAATALSGIIFTVGTIRFVYNGLYGSQEGMDGGGAWMYVGATVGSLALYGLNYFKKREIQNLTPPHS